jgi:hypothetical protein
MIVFIFIVLDAWLDVLERKRADAYFAGAKDLGEIERRMRALESGDAYR